MGTLARNELTLECLVFTYGQIHVKKMQHFVEAFQSMHDHIVKTEDCRV